MIETVELPDPQWLDQIVDRYSIHQPRGYAKGTVARRNMKKRLRKAYAHHNTQILSKVKAPLLEGRISEIKTIRLAVLGIIQKRSTEPSDKECLMALDLSLEERQAKLELERSGGME